MTNPAPVPADADLRDFDFYPLEVRRLLDSALSATDAELFRVSVLSWCVAWHQLPAGSLPDDDGALARLMGFGRDLRGWRKVRAAGGLRGWETATDGRLYHPVVTEKVIAALIGKRKQRNQTEAARLAKQSLSQGKSAHVKRSVTDHATSSVTDSVTGSKLIVESRERRVERGDSAPPVTGNPNETAGAEPATEQASPIDPEQAWRLERLEPWARNLSPVLGSKLGPKNWPAWKRLVDQFSVSQVVQAAETLHPDKRWPAETESILMEVPRPAKVSPIATRAQALLAKHGLAEIVRLTGCGFTDDADAVFWMTENPALADMVERGAA